MATRYLLQTEAELKNLSRIRDFVELGVKSLEFDPTIIPNIQLAVDELVTNVMLHGYGGQGGLLEVELERLVDDLVIRVRDEAPPFNPTTVPTPDLTLPLAKRPVGGLGVHLVRRIMDEISHQVTARGGNELILVKRNPELKEENPTAKED